MSGGEAPRFAPVSAPNPDIAAAARDRQRQLTKPDGALGRLEELSVWVAACQNRCPPEAFQHPRVIVFAGDHGVAAAGVSAYPPSVTAQMVRNIEAGGAAVNVLAALAGASVRVADIAVGRPSGNIAVEDALTEEQAHAALAAGIALADAEIDSGADLLIAGDMGIGNTTPATVLVAALTGSEPVAVVGRGTGVDDAGWARKTAAVRDALRRTKDVRADPVALLARAGGADLAAITGFVAHAAVRRTPVLLDGLVVTAAALVAEQLAPGARQWWLAGHRSTEPAHSLALQRLRLDPVLDLQMRLGEGSGALVALPVLQAAAGTLAQMATFDEARIDGPGA
ncbi:MULTISPECIES: nicotinate-nucleotide--dimethylbenzimidazole phosphoribosyltransferase [Mycobacteroides]|uniref:Nicotinate-nucleotide--dimethylbenzimidazole phosphoribosyltransferase n=1 Tax=Mycobacteroides chelonae TaxID=1774 RepID=A0A1S1LUT9_MYCCH|nr:MULTISPECIES: nicotinate-nucleotide--dimethylbenzimidazole phosphoribosyltransferase [Mycobacteroides]KRQ22263.1 nicotinate-nucleotide--dimethylbenzimidazole phosphoribosyltransferase [Mycobacteroides sp. H003]KRQ27728.1 nicotinate-nucleotide--dimethylbenzimidazole phosphoribosyltransferase [Mycobacteroides sp. H092]KRQ40710.1 nicotinate-nucleotide--dimethylbenzimidazole phosphoribosyltransferase [Mycobacteroides sp. H101]KRQ42406.1 nicotinate-nucleotide--dimethylbenzimidazole phosphoribosyl